MRDREQIMKERELVAEGWRSGVVGDWPESEAQLAAYLDREYPLSPEPTVVTGPSGRVYRLMDWRYTKEPTLELRAWGTREAALRGDAIGSYGVILPEDLPTVSNLLCPFEEVVRAVMDVEQVIAWEHYTSLHITREVLLRLVADHTPAILARLGESR